MVVVRFSNHLRRFVDLPEEVNCKGDTVHAVVAELESSFSGLSEYLLHENGKLRQTVNIFLSRQLNDL